MIFDCRGRMPTDIHQKQRHANGSSIVFEKLFAAEVADLLGTIEKLISILEKQSVGDKFRKKT